MPTPKKTVSEICTSLIGYTEGKNNDTTFGKWFGLNNNPWCDMAVSKVFFDAGRITAIAPKTKPKGFASCHEHLTYLTKNKQLIPIAKAQPEDLIFFQLDTDTEPDHIGILKSINLEKHFAWIWEGNTSSGLKGSQSNGDGYYLRKRDLSLIMAVARPK